MGYLHNFFILATTNVPWALDDGFSSRTKRLYIPIPSSEIKREVFLQELKKYNIGKVYLSRKDFKIMVDKLNSRSYSIREVMDVSITEKLVTWTYCIMNTFQIFHYASKHYAVWLATVSDEWYPVEDEQCPGHYRLVAVKDLGTKGAPPNAPKRKAMDLEKVLSYNKAQKKVAHNYATYSFHVRPLGLRDLLLGLSEVYPQLRDDQQLKYERYLIEMEMLNCN